MRSWNRHAAFAIAVKQWFFTEDPESLHIELRIIAIDGYRPDGPLDAVIVDLDAPISQEKPPRAM